MLRFWFHRNSPFPRLLEILGVVVSVLILKQELPHPDLATWLYLLVLLNALLIWGCDWKDWYAPADRQLGIAVHFRKARIPTSYILVITSLLYAAGLRYAIVIPAVLCLLAISFVNGILIHFHHHDKDPLPINYFSSNKYLHEKKSQLS